MTISVINDAASELDETFGAILQRNPTDPVATYLAKTDWTIHDDDAAPTNYAVSASASPVAENGGSITFTVTRSGSSLPAETIYASTVSGAANGYSANSSDYNGLVNRQVTFLANQTIAQVTVPIIDDTVPESVDTFGFLVQRNAADPVSTYLAKTNWTIQDDDGSAGTTYSATPNANPVGEGAGTLSFTITRSGNLPSEILYASTVNGSANGYSGNVGDYTGTVNQQVSFAANQATAQVAISIANDATPENDETFGFVVQRNAADSVLTSLASTNWVIHDDDTGTIADYTVTPSARLVSAGQGPLTFTISRTGTNSAGRDGVREHSRGCERVRYEHRRLDEQRSLPASNI